MKGIWQKEYIKFYYWNLLVFTYHNATRWRGSMFTLEHLSFPNQFLSPYLFIKDLRGVWMCIYMCVCVYLKGMKIYIIKSNLKKSTCQKDDWESSYIKVYLFFLFIYTDKSKFNKYMNRQADHVIILLYIICQRLWYFHSADFQ